MNLVVAFVNQANGDTRDMTRAVSFHGARYFQEADLQRDLRQAGVTGGELNNSLQEGYFKAA